MRNTILCGDVCAKLRELPAESVHCVVTSPPFMGIGTTALVALRAGRDYIGIELNESYVEMANRRLASLLAQARLL